jgi:hypothetical protein
VPGAPSVPRIDENSVPALPGELSDAGVGANEAPEAAREPLAVGPGAN